MLYKIAHFFRDHVSCLWDLAESLNSFTFRVLHSSDMKQLPMMLKDYNNGKTSMRIAGVDDTCSLCSFFSRQPDSCFTHFKPHDFDHNTIRNLLRRTSFIMIVVENNECQNKEVVGYFFLRCFVNGQCYLGKMVDYQHQGQGIGKQMCRAAMEIAQFLKLRMFESINKENMASMRSSGSVLKQIVVKELDHGDLLIEDLPLEKS